MAQDQEVYQRFMEAYEKFADAIFRHCYFRIHNRERAQDLVQEVFLKTWDYLAQGNKIQHMRAFLYKVATNAIIDETRKRPAASLDELQEKGWQPGISQQNPEKTLAGREAVELLCNLDPQSRQVLVMRYIDDLMPKQIAEILGESVDVVSVRIYRALEKIRTIYGEKY